ncbi:MAG: hypothetical protein SFU99_23300 [Saprospiraceae bacterium]|nr:hypothetical protein [Saprospiraceae bacterium]
MENSKHFDDLGQIRSIMERSTKFLSLSAWAAILAGVYALIGAFFAYRLIYFAPVVRYRAMTESLFSPEVLPLFFDAIIVLALAVGTTVWLSYRKARKAGQKLWTPAAIRVLVNFSIPLVTGGLFTLVLYMNGYFSLIVASTLIFYGLALLNAGNFTFSDIRKLGMIEILIGFAAALFPGKGLLFWALGFGVLHIVYGIIMYWKYER